MLEAALKALDLSYLDLYLSAQLLIFGGQVLEVRRALVGVLLNIVVVVVVVVAASQAVEIVKQCPPTEFPEVLLLNEQVSKMYAP